MMTDLGWHNEKRNFSFERDTLDLLPELGKGDQGLAAT